MAVPSFAGIQLFGPTPEFEHDDPPNFEQVNHYPGVRGVQRIDLGLGRTTTRVHGILMAGTLADLGAFAASIRTLKIAGGFATLIDTDGITWNDAVLTHFQTHGPTVPVTSDAGSGWAKRYTMEFTHLGFGS